eukprot:CAMPEP_0170187326 /NCGR_PEP_ID=MMETSP0040_2-20121228/41424_1 /TAXON_ID=641309 /ORGANISM="Lotharella oceanica, Strain CCMP622" /LENGTH=190 /DNA_ID=CAMNT_0010434333 /DNA_START=18 /DNA_END=590 /DNA_ORIENTATION=-
MAVLKNLMLGAVLAVVVAVAYVQMLPKDHIVTIPLPEEGKAASELLIPALEKVSKRHGVSVRASLFNQKLESMYRYHMEGVPELMGKIARSKCKSLFDGKELQNPSLHETLFFYMLPWVFGFTPYMSVQGSLLVEFKGVPACFVVNGAPAASTDLEIATQSLLACGFEKTAKGTYALPANAGSSERSVGR